MVEAPDEFVKSLQVLAAIHFPSMLPHYACHIYCLTLNLKFSVNKTYYVDLKVCITKLSKILQFKRNLPWCFFFFFFPVSYWTYRASYLVPIVYLQQNCTIQSIGYKKIV